VVRSLAAAARWVDAVGLALLFPKADVVLPSLWEQVNGSAEENWAIRDGDGKFVSWTEEMGFLWSQPASLHACCRRSWRRTGVWRRTSRCWRPSGNWGR
jgi:hypothetical protein